jgi:hypothetical protein
MNKVAQFTTPLLSSNYALSTWVYLTPLSKDRDPNTSSFVPLFDLNGNPKVHYNPGLNTLRITVAQKQKDVLVADIPRVPLQRWHHLVLAYNYGTFDVFLNGALFRSVPGITAKANANLDTSGNPVDTTLTVGAANGYKENKLCNFVLYHNDVDQKNGTANDAITLPKVVALYNNYIGKNPPSTWRKKSGKTRRVKTNTRPTFFLFF